MSIHQLAHHLQSAGRGEDKVLVHMTPKEVNGLQALAMAHGGSLTINPKTGLPEAGFLSAILPMVAGFFLGPAGLGIAQSALGAGAMVGAATGIATGSLTKGLMAGLGAYGGFGLAEGLAAAAPGAAGAGASAANAANVANATNATAAANLAATGPAAAVPNAANVLGGGTSTVTGAGALGGSQAASLNQSLMQGPFAGTGISAAQSPAIVAANQVPSATQVALNAPVAQTSVLQGGAGTVAEKAAMAQQAAAQQAAAAKAASTPVTNWENVKSGFGEVTSSGDKAWNFIKKNPTPFIGAGLGLLSEFSGSNAGASGAKKQPGTIRPYEYSVEQDPNAYLPTASTAERRYFVEPRFTAGTPYTAKDGGLMSLAVGGAVEEMSARNAISANTMYPQAQMQTDIYSNPMMQRPMPSNVINAGLDTPTNAYTGEIRMASGGAAAKKAEPTKETKYSYDPATMQYTQTTTAAPAAGNLSGNPFVDGMVGLFGVGPYAMGGNKGIGMGGFNPNGLMAKLNAQAAQQPTSTTETLGGIAAPYVPQNQEVIAQPPAPTTNIPQPQNVNQQLGLEGFYNMMGDQLAMKGAQMQNQGQGFAVGGSTGGISDLGGYSDGGRLLKGPGDGVSDSIPASIGNRQPARLADGEFVVPARIVSEIGNGSTEAGARKLYAMMDRVQKARKKTVGKNQVAKNTKAEKLLPA
jgi:hypothetical protein